MNEHFTYRLEGELDIQALERAANLLLDRHELLRCAFKMVGDLVMLEVQPGAAIHINLVKVWPWSPLQQAHFLPLKHHSGHRGLLPLACRGGRSCLRRRLRSWPSRRA